MTIICPQPFCAQVQHYQCTDKSCDCQKIPAGELGQLWTDDGEGLICPYCGFSASMDFWFVWGCDAASASGWGRLAPQVAR